MAESKPLVTIDLDEYNRLKDIEKDMCKGISKDKEVLDILIDHVYRIGRSQDDIPDIIEGKNYKCRVMQDYNPKNSRITYSFDIEIK